jgi:hypothetical protein
LQEVVMPTWYGVGVEMPFPGVVVVGGAVVDVVTVTRVVLLVEPAAPPKFSCTQYAKLLEGMQDEARIGF